MKKRKLLAGCMAIVLLLGVSSVMHMGVPEKWEGQATEKFHPRVPSWLNWGKEGFGSFLTDLASKQAQSALEAEIDVADSEYDRATALAKREALRNSTIKGNYNQMQLNFRIPFTTFIRFNSDAPPSQPSQPTQSPTSTQSTTQSTPAPTPTPAPVVTIPSPVSPVNYSTSTNYYFSSTSDTWLELWYNTSSMLYLRGSVPADCDTSNQSGWTMSVDLGDRTITVQGSGSTEGATGSSLGVYFTMSSSDRMAIEDYFIAGGENVPIVFRYSTGSGTKTLSLAEQAYMCYDNMSLKLLVEK